MADNDIITALGFDFGLKKIGVAIGQTLTNTARPLAIIPCKNNTPNYTEIENIIKSWRPNVIVVGIPHEVNNLNQNNNQTTQSIKTNTSHKKNKQNSNQEVIKQAQNFAKKLDKKYSVIYKLEIQTTDESYSSVEAKKIFADLRKNKLIKQGEKLDHIAACIILQRWLER